jgi:hypothetical protein
LAEKSKRMIQMLKELDFEDNDQIISIIAFSRSRPVMQSAPEA